jgi:hypothetical protein
MSLVAFQDALAALVASPDDTRRVRAGDAAPLDRYDLTSRERERLVAVARQPGMAVNCVLYRAHRMVPLMSLFGRTCAWLGEGLRAEVDAFWATTTHTMIQFEVEAKAFGRHLLGRVAARDLIDPVVADLVAVELAMVDLRFLTAGERRAAPGGRNPLVRVLRLRHDVESLLRAEPVAAAGYAVVDARGGGEPVAYRPDPAVAAAWAAFEAGGPGTGDVELLRDAGLLA